MIYSFSCNTRQTENNDVKWQSNVFMISLEKQQTKHFRWLWLESCLSKNMCYSIRDGQWQVDSAHSLCSKVLAHCTTVNNLNYGNALTIFLSSHVQCFIYYILRLIIHNLLYHSYISVPYIYIVMRHNTIPQQIKKQESVPWLNTKTV